MYMFNYEYLFTINFFIKYLTVIYLFYYIFLEYTENSNIFTSFIYNMNSFVSLLRCEDDQIKEYKAWQINLSG